MCGFIAQLVEHRTGIAEVTPGVLIDQNLSWKYHIDSIVTKISKNVGLIAKLRHSVPRPILLNIYNSLIHPYLTYGLAAYVFV